MSDISGIIKGTGVALEKEAFKQFGAAVENQAKGLLGNIFGDGGGAPPKLANDASVVTQNIEPGVWDPTPYASAIASGKGNFDPKTKFLFKVGFKLNPTVTNAAARLNVDIDVLNRDLTFLVKQVDLPKVNFEYQEVNLYNFKTKVLKSIGHREISLSFYDDTGNRALDFVNVYMKLLRPSSRMVPTRGTALENYGMAFDGSLSALDSAGRAALLGGAINILDQIIIEQYYIDRTTPIAFGALLMNSYVLTNPRIESFDIGDVNYEEGSSPAMINATFNFDTLHIQTKLEAPDSSQIPSLAGADMMQNAEREDLLIKRGNPMAAGASRNPFVDILARQGQRLVQTAIASKMHKYLGGVAGGALSGATSAISSTLGTAAGRTLGNVAGGVTSSISKLTSPPVKDSSTSSSQVADLSRQAPSADQDAF